MSIQAVCADCGKALDFKAEADSCTEFKHAGVRWLTVEPSKYAGRRFAGNGVVVNSKPGQN